MTQTTKLLLAAAVLIMAERVIPAQSSISGAAVPAQQEKHFEKKIQVTAKLEYLLYLPPEYHGSRHKWPLILFLHGAGESGTNLAKVKIHGPPKLLETTNMSFIVVSPQSPGRGWEPEALNALLDEILHRYRIDRDRVYLTGLSMGASGTWSLAVAHPDKFAAIAPICGGGNPGEVRKLGRLPIWVFHGAKDPVVPLRRSEEMVEAVKAAGGDVKLTVYPEAEHDSWTETYNNPRLYQWFLEHRRHR